MEITKQQLFAMYLANENQKVRTHYKDGSFIDRELSLNMADRLYPFSDCQLILKPLSEMSEEGKREYALAKEPIIKEIPTKEALEYMLNDPQRKDIDVLPDGRITVRKTDNIASVLWLIQNGYALSDKYFTNGWAVKVRDVK